VSDLKEVSLSNRTFPTAHNYFLSSPRTFSLSFLKYKLSCVLLCCSQKSWRELCTTYCFKALSMSTNCNKKCSQRRVPPNRCRTLSDSLLITIITYLKYTRENIIFRASSNEEKSDIILQSLATFVGSLSEARDAK